MTNAETVEQFYTAFQKGDGQAMADLYADDATFSDPVFPNLSGNEPGAMWRMLTSRATDMKLEFTPPKSDGDKVTTTWQAWYTFSATNRKVHNIIQSELTVRDGKIVTQKDHFDFWRWSRQALGAKGVLLGWSPVVKNAVQGQADKGLRLYMKRHRIT